MNGRTPTMESRPLAEAVVQAEIEQLLRDYVKPAFIRMSGEKRKKAIEVLNKMAAEE